MQKELRLARMAQAMGLPESAKPAQTIGDAIHEHLAELHYKGIQSKGKVHETQVQLGRGGLERYGRFWRIWRIMWCHA
jgi:hypothetical protein